MLARRFFASCGPCLPLLCILLNGRALHTAAFLQRNLLPGAHLDLLLSCGSVRRSWWTKGRGPRRR